MNSRRPYCAVLMILACSLALLAIPIGDAASEESKSPAVGFAIGLRAPVASARSVVTSVSSVPEFVVGYRGDRYAVGVGLGLVRAKAADDYETITGNTFQIEPSACFDFWQSPDGFTRGNVSMGFGIGRASLTDEYEGEYEDSKDEVSCTLFSFHLGMGGDHFLSPHFALGAEGGFQGAFASNIKEKGNPDEHSLSASGLYGMFRTMVVF